MTKKKSRSHRLRVCLTLIGVGLTALIYQNCAVSSSSPAIAGTISQEELDAQASAVLKKSGASCEDAAAYQCEVRTFGPTQQSGERTRTECLTGGRCVEVLEFRFNTAANIQGCSDCSAEDITSRYDRSEIRCMNSLVAAAGTLPIQADGDSLEYALDAAQNKCRVLAASGQ